MTEENILVLTIGLCLGTLAASLKILYDHYSKKGEVMKQKSNFRLVMESLVIPVILGLVAGVILTQVFPL